MAQAFKLIRTAQTDDPLFVKRAFVSHYLNIPYHVTLDSSLYPKTLIEELFAVSYYLVRNFELSPYQQGNIEDKVLTMLNNGEL